VPCRGKANPLESFAQVRSGESHLLRQSLGGQAQVHRIHGQSDDVKLPRWKMGAERPENEGGRPPLAGPGQRPGELVLQILRRKKDQIPDPCSSQVEEDEGIEAPGEEENQPEVGIEVPKTRQDPFSGRIGGHGLQIHQGPRDGTLPYDPVQPAPGVTQGQGVVGFQEVGQSCLQPPIPRQNRQKSHRIFGKDIGWTGNEWAEPRGAAQPYTSLFQPAFEAGPLLRKNPEEIP